MGEELIENKFQTRKDKFEKLLKFIQLITSKFVHHKLSIFSSGLLSKLNVYCRVGQKSLTHLNFK